MRLRIGQYRMVGSGAPLFYESPKRPNASTPERLNGHLIGDAGALTAGSLRAYRFVLRYRSKEMPRVYPWGWGLDSSFGTHPGCWSDTPTLSCFSPILLAFPCTQPILVHDWMGGALLIALPSPPILALIPPPQPPNHPFVHELILLSALLLYDVCT